MSNAVSNRNSPESPLFRLFYFFFHLRLEYAFLEILLYHPALYSSVGSDLNKLVHIELFCIIRLKVEIGLIISPYRLINQMHYPFDTRLIIDVSLQLLLSYVHFPSVPGRSKQAWLQVRFDGTAIYGIFH